MADPNQQIFAYKMTGFDALVHAADSWVVTGVADLTGAQYRGVLNTPLRLITIAEQWPIGPGPTPESFEWTAACPPSIAVGDLVAVDGSMPSATTVQLIDITSPLRMPAAGIVVSKPTSASCTVVSSGVVNAQDLVPGAICFASRAGRVSFNPPTATTGPAFVQAVGVALSATQLLVSLPSSIIELAP
jgi:hypothetical protein